MKKIKYYIILATLAFGTTSCLDKYPEDAILADKAITTVDEADQAVIGIYSSFLSGALYSRYLTLLPDIQADFVYAVNGYTNTYGNIWRWDIQATDTQITSVYTALYGVIGRCNFLLDNAVKIKQTLTDDDQLDRLDQYCGEAYFARALAYSELIKLFCKAYESEAEAANELGIVIRSKYYSDEPTKRASLAESYRFVLDDLDRAASLLALEEDYDPSSDGYLYNSTYFNEYTVHALRARVALYMKDYDAAIKYSTKVIDSGQYILSSASTAYTSSQSYYQYMWTSDNSTEIIWKIGYTSTNYGSPTGSIFFNYNYVSFKPDYVPAQWVLDLYAANDLRYSIFFQQYTTGYSHGLTWPLLVKYWGNTDLYNTTYILNLSMPKVFRLSEQYLIRAEAYAMKEQPDYNKAGKDITTLRVARYQSYGGGTTLTKSNALDVIEEERVKELYMEGFRLNDLKRWHKGFTRKQQTETLTNGSTLSIEKENPLFVWPIPQHELEAPGSEIEPNESNK
ncbi:MAG: RagB/SusD family nutrient uptake outer membrane protein [Bacteroides sp.]|nr:RagB/SusD family nutrient uptake outer membrane protein [Bacteroides sp.]